MWGNHGTSGLLGGHSYHLRTEGIRRETSSQVLRAWTGWLWSRPLTGALTLYQDRSQPGQVNLVGGKVEDIDTSSSLSCFPQTSCGSSSLAEHNRNPEGKGDADVVSLWGKRAGRESWKVALKNWRLPSSLSEESKYLMLLMTFNDLFLSHLPQFPFIL